MGLWSAIWRLLVLFLLYFIMISGIKSELEDQSIFVQIIVYSTISFLWVYITLVYFTKNFGSLVLVM